MPVARSPADLRAALAGRLADRGEQWLTGAIDHISTDPGAIRTLFPAAGRRCGRDWLRGTWTVDDAVRALLLTALPLSGTQLTEEVTALYRYGDAAEKRGVLRGMHLLDTAGGIGAGGLPVVEDGLRTNDTRLIAAALASYGARHLDPAAYRQGVLKCVFLGIPLADIDGLGERADAELARMLVDYAHERVAAGRDVPADVWTVVDRFPDTLESSAPGRGFGGFGSDVDARRDAALRASAGREPSKRARPSEPGGDDGESGRNPGSS